MLSSTERTTHRRSKWARTGREDLYAVLDAGLVCHLGLIAEDRSAEDRSAEDRSAEEHRAEDYPMVVPTGYGRIGDTLYLHGSTASRALRTRRPVCVTVTHLDGIVLARSAFHHSVNYRAAMIYGRLRPVDDPQERLDGLRALVEHLAPGQWQATRRPTAKELAATTVVALPLDEASVKIRTGPPGDDEEDYALPIWAGVLPVRQVFDPPQPDPRLAPGTPVPGHVAGRA
jgi:uncharacterized protein